MYEYVSVCVNKHRGSHLDNDFCNDTIIIMNTNVEGEI